jgi:hypothetical protein
MIYGQNYPKSSVKIRIFKGLFKKIMFYALNQLKTIVSDQSKAQYNFAIYFLQN